MSAPDDRRSVVHPDYRYTLANERTFLAWVRTALAMLAGGVGVVNLPSGFATAVGRHVLGIVLVLLGLLAAAGSYLRWRGNEAAIREGRPLPQSAGISLVGAGLTGVAVIALVLVLIDVS